MWCLCTLFQEANACQPPTRKIIALASSTGITIFSHALLFNNLRNRNPRDHKLRQFHFVFEENGNKRLPHSKSWTPRAGVLPHHLVHRFFAKWAPVSLTRGWKPELVFQQTPSSGNRCLNLAERRWNRASHLSVASVAACQLGREKFTGTAIHIGLVPGHGLRPQPGHPKSKI